MPGSWYQTANAAPLSQLGATMGQGVTPNAAGTGMTTSVTTEMVERYLKGQQEEADREYGLKRDALDSQRDIALRSARTAEQAQSINKWYQQEQVKIARERMDLEDRHFQQSHELAQGRLGYDLLGLGLQARGPRNFAQYLRLAEGTAAMPQTATLFDNLDKQTSRVGGYQAFGPGNLDPQTLSSIRQDLTGQAGGVAAPGAGGGVSDARADLERERAEVNYYAMNPHKIASGVWESWNPDKQELFGSIAEDSGASMPTFMRGLASSRVGNTYGNRA